MNNSYQYSALIKLNQNKLLPQLVKEGFLLKKDCDRLKKKPNVNNIKLQINQTFTLVQAKKKELNKIRNLFNKNYKYLCLSYKGFKLNTPRLVKENGELLEQFCWSGHNAYPFPKILDKLMADEINIYITRDVAKFTVAILKKSMINFSSLSYKTYESFLKKRVPILLKKIQKIILLKDDETIIPIHYFQLRHDLFLKKLENKGKIRIITIPYKHLMLTSTRTIYLFNDNICIKLPINIKITSEKRLIFQSFSHNAPIFGQIIKKIIKKEAIQSIFSISEDIASVRIKNYFMAKHLCAIFREPVLISKNIYPANYLFEIYDVKTNKRVIHELLYYKLENKRKLINIFFEKYIRVIIQAPLILYIKYGIGTEPHLQNSFILFDNKFMPVQLILRDIDGININISVLSQKIDITSYKFHQLTHFMFKSDKFSRIRLWDSLILFHIQELINALTNKYSFSNKELWHKVIKEIKLILNKLSSDPDNKERINMFNKYFLSEIVPTRAFIKMKLSNRETFKTINVKNFLFIKS